MMTVVVKRADVTIFSRSYNRRFVEIGEERCGMRLMKLESTVIGQERLL